MPLGVPVPSFRGYNACSCLAKWLPEYEKELLRRGLIKRNIDVLQLIGGAPKSGGTHVSGGAFDIAQTSREAIRIARQMGADATWHRPQNWDNRGGGSHTHGVLTGCPHNGPARYQITDVRKGLNGLANRGSDTGPRPLSGRTWKQGIAWAKAQRKPLRLLSWNVSLKLRHPRLSVAYRTSKIAAYVKGWNVDVMGVQECPSSGDGKALFPKLARIGLTQRTGSHARYIFFRKDAKVHGWKSWEIDEKRFTVAVATIRGKKRAFINCHPVSGSNKAGTRTAWAKKVIRQVDAYCTAMGVPDAERIYFGDFNGGEFAVVAKSLGMVRARTYARIKSALIRTYNAWGKKRTTPGGQFDYVLVPAAMKKRIAKAKTFLTPKASDHNPVFVEIKE